MKCKTKQGSNTIIEHNIYPTGSAVCLEFLKKQGHVTGTKRGMERRSVSQNAPQYIVDERDRVMTAASNDDLSVHL